MSYSIPIRQWSGMCSKNLAISAKKVVLLLASGLDVDKEEGYIMTAQESHDSGIREVVG
jgi:hypothetical protein